MENIHNEQGKHPYEKPEIEVIELENEALLLVGSNTSGVQRPDYQPEEW
jgi:hypothetical protein